MKAVFSLVLASLVSLSAHAHSFSPVDKLTNPQAQASLQASDAIHEQDQQFTASVSYKISVIKPAQKAGESQVDLYERVLKSALHGDYPITGDDGGYSFGQVRGANARNVIESYIRDYNYDDISTDAFAAALASAAQDETLIVLMGDGSGNNTFAHIAAVIDPVRSEMVYFILSNFGSDS